MKVLEWKHLRRKYVLLFHPNFSEEWATYFASLPLHSQLYWPWYYPCQGQNRPPTVRSCGHYSGFLTEWTFPLCLSVLPSLMTPSSLGSPVPPLLFCDSFLMGCPQQVSVCPELHPQLTARHTPLLSCEAALIRAGAPGQESTLIPHVSHLVPDCLVDVW